MRWPRAFVLCIVVGLLTAPSAWAKHPAPTGTSTITAPGNGALLFYNGDNGSGGVTVRGSVSGDAWGSTGDLLCYWNNNGNWVRVASKLPISNGGFASNVSLFGIAGRVCRLSFVPAGWRPTGTDAAPFAGPVTSVADQFSHSSNGSLFGYDVLSGTIPWSFEFGSLGECPIVNSFATDATSLGSFALFTGNACLPSTNSVTNSSATRSSIQVDGLNAYAPGAISGLSSDPGFSQIVYSTTFGGGHTSVMIREYDNLMICNAPGGYPPTTGSCPGLHSAGVQVQQLTQLLPGSQVAQVTQRFVSIDGRSHRVDMLFSQQVQASTSGEPPGFELPRQTSFAVHGAPDSYAPFPAGPGSIFVIGNPVLGPAVSNPIGAITYGRPPISAAFISASGSQAATFLMHYNDSIPARAAISYAWSFSQSSSLAGIARLEALQRDRFSTPAVAVARPRNRSVVHTPVVAVVGRAVDRVGIASVTVNGRGVAVARTGSFITTLRLRRGRNPINVVATNDAGNRRGASLTVTFTPRPCKVPALRGKPLATAESALRAAGCAVGPVTSQRSRRIRKGRVISTVPGAGARRANGTKVRIVVSSGR